MKKTAFLKALKNDIEKLPNSKKYSLIDIRDIQDVFSSLSEKNKAETLSSEAAAFYQKYDNLKVSYRIISYIITF